MALCGGGASPLPFASTPPPLPSHAPFPPQGVMWYPAVNIVIAVLLPLLTALAIAGRYMCCCCSPNRCTLLRCGAAWPTRKRPLCGFTDLHTGTVGYPAWERHCTRLLMVVFLAFGTALIVSGNVAGNYALTTGMAGVGSVGDGLQITVQAAIPPAMQLVVAVSATALLPMLKR